MTRAELAERIASGESSGVEFKRDGVSAYRFAREMVGLLNHHGGSILLGVEDDGTVSGLTREAKAAEEWVMEVGRTHVDPPVIPWWEAVRWDDSRAVGVATVPADSPDRPYKVRKGSDAVTLIRVGTTTRNASRMEEMRLYQRSGNLEYGRRPLPGAPMEALDWRRMRDYFLRTLGRDCPDGPDWSFWRPVLENLDLAAEVGGRATATVAGMLLFGARARRFLPQSGIHAVCFPGLEPDHAKRDDEVIAGPLLPLRESDGSLLERGLTDKAWDFLRRTTKPTVVRDRFVRDTRWDVPEDVLREAVVNALAHRDYSRVGADIQLLIYADRVEIISPGGLPNAMTLEKMRAGKRSARNPMLVDFLRSYRYVDALGMGVSTRMIPGMRRHNGTEPEFEADEDRFTVRLFR